MAGASPMSTGSGSPCGACKFLRRKCAADCVFAPYFSSEQGAARFAAIHKVFGASNVSKLLHNIPVHDRCEAVVTIAYEAQARIRDPVYGCVAHIFALQQQVAYLQGQLMQAKSQLGQAAVMNNNNNTQRYWQLYASGDHDQASININQSCYQNNHHHCIINPMSPQSSQENSEERYSASALSNFLKINRPNYDPQLLGELQELALTMMKN